MFQGPNAFQYKFKTLINLQVLLIKLQVLLCGGANVPYFFILSFCLTILLCIYSIYHFVNGIAILHREFIQIMVGFFFLN